MGPCLCFRPACVSNRETVPEKLTLDQPSDSSSDYVDLDVIAGIRQAAALGFSSNLQGETDQRCHISATGYMFVASIILLSSVIVKLLQLRQKFTIDVLKPAMYSTLLTVFCWGIACLATLCLFKSNREYSAFLDQFWYWTAVFSCCPLISVLGARRPTSRIWTWFIIVPLIAVLGWPAVTSLSQFPKMTVLEIQLPVFIGFILVLVMGVGNYMGSRYGLSTLLCGIAVIVSLWPLSNLFEDDLASANFWRASAATLFGLGMLHGFRQAKRPSLVESPFDLLWFDFSDSFGIVWSIRIQDRINQVAEQEQWGVRLGTEGFHWHEDISEKERIHSADRLEQTLRWLLRRFVEKEWIDQRLNSSTTISGVGS